MNRFTVGSKAFFSCYEDFTPHDNDTLILVDNPIDFKVQRQIRLKGDCIFEWKRMSPSEFIDYHKPIKTGLFIGKFLVPEFAKEIGFTIDNLKEVSHLLDYLDEKHEYEKIIYNAYIENNDFILLDKQRMHAYNKYKEYREKHS